MNVTTTSPRHLRASCPTNLVGGVGPGAGSGSPGSLPWHDGVDRIAVEAAPAVPA